MAVAPVGFSWVNYTSTSVVEKDEEDTSIIKSHTMRVVHRERQKRPRRVRHSASKLLPTLMRRKTLQVDQLLRRDGTLVYRPETDWEGLAICGFMDDFAHPLQSSPDNAMPYLSFLPALYNRYSPRSCLTEAVSAVALARLANQTRAVDLSIRARTAYTNALSMVNQSMSITETQTSNQLLTTLCLLTKYEIVSGDAHKNGSLDCHERGQAALISQQDEEWLRSEVGASLFRLVYMRHQLNCIAQSHKPAINVNTHSHNLVFPTPYLRKLMRIIAQIAHLRYDTATQVHQPPKSIRELCYIARDAVKVDKQMTALFAELPASMRYHSITNTFYPPTARKDSYQPTEINLFRHLQHASFWYVFWYGRLHLLQTLLQLAPFQLSIQPETLRARLQDTLGDICASVPYALNEHQCNRAFIDVRGGRAVAAHYLIWVLAAASSAAGVSEAQREWISDRLKIIGFVHGIKQALVFAPGERDFQQFVHAEALSTLLGGTLDHCTCIAGSIEKHKKIAVLLGPQMIPNGTWLNAR